MAERAAAKTVGELITPKQLWMIRTKCAELGLNPEEEAAVRFDCALEELSKRAASQWIDALQGKGSSSADTGPAAGFATQDEISTQDEATKPQAKAPKAYARPLGDILTDLSKPIAAQHLQQKKKGGMTLDYIPWYNAIKYLDYYAPGWRSEIRSVVWFDSRLILTVRLTIVAAEGETWREATGTEEEPEEGKQMYGDPSSNAESMALRRAAAKFGLGLYLYDKKRS